MLTQYKYCVDFYLFTRVVVGYHDNILGLPIAWEEEKEEGGAAAEKVFFKPLLLFSLSFLLSLFKASNVAASCVISSFHNGQSFQFFLLFNHQLQEQPFQFNCILSHTPTQPTPSHRSQAWTQHFRHSTCCLFQFRVCTIYMKNMFATDIEKLFLSVPCVQTHSSKLLDF